MSTIIMIPNTSSHSSLPSLDHAPSIENSPRCPTHDYDEDRRDFVHPNLNHNPSSNSHHTHVKASSMISLSYTENAAFEPPLIMMDETECKSETKCAPSLAEYVAMERRRRHSNITQIKDIVPPKKMKKEATVKELRQVINHHKIAQNKDIEDILTTNEPHVLNYRDKLYLEAHQNGITQHSSDAMRLKILAAVVEYAFMNIEPPNEYTKQTDRKHFKEVGAWAAKFAKDKGVVPSLVLIYAAWCHDIE
eukprot:389628_1